MTEKRIINQKIENGDGSTTYRIIRLTGNRVRLVDGEKVKEPSARMGVSIFTKPFEQRSETADRLRKARRDLRGLMAACGRR